MQKIIYWAPAILCCFVSILYLFAPQARAAFLSFLPICFLIAAINQVALLNRIENLEQINSRDEP